MNIILIAPPAAGKGTQAKILKDKYNLAHISTGDLLRDASSKDDELGNELRKVMASGSLVNDELVLKLLKNRIQQDDCKNGYILDGFPRNVDQAIKYDEILKTINKDIGYVFLLDVDKNILLERITGRRICKNCGSIYNVNIESSKPEKDLICDKCNGELYQREDDNEQSFNTRYDEYINKTEPLIEYYENKHCLYHINALDSKENILKQIESVLEER